MPDLCVEVDNAAPLLTATGDHQERLRSEARFPALCCINSQPASSDKTHRIVCCTMARAGRLADAEPAALS